MSLFTLIRITYTRHMFGGKRVKPSTPWRSK